MLRIAITDDDALYIEKLQNYFETFFTEHAVEHEIRVYTSGKALINDCTKQMYDVLVLDIDMPELSGIEIAEKIRRRHSNAVLIFVTNMEQLVFESFKYTPYRFIRKSKIEVEIPELLQSLQNKFASESMVYQFSLDGETKRIKLTEILFFESFKHDILLHDCYGYEYRISEPLNSLLKKYENAGFIRIHKSYLVNYRYIYEIKRNSVVLDSKDELPLSKNRITEIKRQYANLTRREMH